jgi:hypothetical protein
MQNTSQIFALLLIGQDAPEYFQLDSWRVDEGCLRLYKGDEAFAVFSMRNVVGLLNLHANAHLTKEQADGKIANFLEPLNLK